MNEQDRTVAKRQIARLVGGSTLPIYVLSEDDVLVFANDSLGDFLGIPADDLLGLDCSLLFLQQESLKEDRSQIRSLLALPINWSRTAIKVLPLDFKHLESTRSNSAVSFDERWTRCLLPLELDGKGCTLVVIGKISFDDNLWVDDTTSAIQSSIMRCRSEYSELSAIWFLQGDSPLIVRALQQTQLAASSVGGVVIFGPQGSGAMIVARHVAAVRWKQRAAKTDSNAFNDRLIQIDCSLMDTDLLQGMLDIAIDLSHQKAVEVSVILESFDRLPQECVLMLDRFLARKLPIEFFITCADTSLSEPWKQLLIKLSLHRVELPKLSSRCEDFRTLIASWFYVQSDADSLTREYSQAFLDALIAYPWPNDTEEFGETLRSAVVRASDNAILSIEHLPVSIRTCASHFEHIQEDLRIDLDRVLEDVERTLVMKAMERFPTNKAAAAKLLHISRARLIRRLHHWGIQTVIDDDIGTDDPPIFNEVDT